MKKADELKKALKDLFLSETTDEDDEDEIEIETMLDDIDYSSLLQVLTAKAEEVFEYQADGQFYMSFDYRSRELFSIGAVKTYQDMGTATITDITITSHSYELWLLPDMTFAVTSCFMVDIDKGEYVTKYRTYKGHDWRDTEMTIEFETLVEDLQDLSMSVYEHETPLYEL